MIAVFEGVNAVFVRMLTFISIIVYLEKKSNFRSAEGIFPGCKVYLIIVNVEQAILHLSYPATLKDL